MKSLNEISKKLAANYTRDAALDSTRLGNTLGRAQMDGGISGKEIAKHAGHKIDKRLQGIRRATDRMTKEDVAQVNELSIDTIKKYKTYGTLKAVRQGSDIYDREVEGGKKPDPKQHAALAKTKQGLARANARLNKEEVEQVDELSNKTLGRYADKARADITKTVSKMATDPKAAGRVDKRVAGLAASTVAKFKNNMRKEDTELSEKFWDNEGEMIKSQLTSICAKAEEIMGKLNDESKLEAWIQSEVTTAQDCISCVHDHIMFSQDPIGEEMTTKLHPNALHVKPVKTAQGTRYKVHAVGSNLSHGIKVGEHLSDTHLDDASEMGAKIKHIKESTLASILDEAGRGRPRKNPVAAPKKSSSGEDDHEDYGPDTGPEANMHIQNQLKRAHDAKDLKGGADVHFENGKKHFVKSEHAHKVLSALEKLKPADRADAAAHVYKSHEHFQAVHSMLK